MTTTTDSIQLQTLKQAHSRDACYYGDRPDWLIAYQTNRDADTLTRANWQSMLDTLGGESDTVAIERSSHWAVGWVEYLVIDPVDKAHVELAQSILTGLEDYPVVDEEALSRLEWEEYRESWEQYGASDFARALAKCFDLSNVAREVLADSASLREFYESLIVSGEYYVPEGDSVRLQVDYAAAKCSRDSMAAFLRVAKQQ